MWFLTWLNQHFYEVLILLYLAWNHRAVVLTPLKGGNGIVQMAELGQMIILIMTALSAKAEAERDHEWQVYPDSYWYALLGAVILIAGLKGGKDLIATFKGTGNHLNEVKGKGSTLVEEHVT